MDGILPGVWLAARSRVWHTAPVGPPDQPWYANLVAALACPPETAPEDLFSALRALERELGRNRILERRFGPRVLDVDLLLFGREHRPGPELILPHPRMLVRAFVLAPLAEVAPGLLLPGGHRVEQALATLNVQGFGPIIM